MDQRWRSWTSPLAWVLIGSCAVLAAATASSAFTRDDGGGLGYLGPVPTGMSLAVLAAAALHSVVHPQAKDRTALGIIGAIVLAAAVAIGVNNAAVGLRAGAAASVWAELAIATVHLVAALGTVLVTIVWAIRPGSAGGSATAGGSQAATRPPEQQPSWSAEHAVGASWTRAGDAATGAPAVVASGTGWGVPANEADTEMTPAPQALAETGIARPVPGIPTAADWVEGSTPTQPPADQAPSDPALPDHG